MRGMPALHYEEHIQKVRFWTDRVRTVPPSLTTSNKLLIVTCSHIQEKIGVWVWLFVGVLVFFGCMCCVTLGQLSYCMCVMCVRVCNSVLLV